MKPACKVNGRPFQGALCGLWNGGVCDSHLECVHQKRASAAPRPPVGSRVRVESFGRQYPKGFTGTVLTYVDWPCAFTGFAYVSTESSDRPGLGGAGRAYVHPDLLIRVDESPTQAPAPDSEQIRSGLTAARMIGALSEKASADGAPQLAALLHGIASALRKAVS